ncbi:MAG: DUF692 domain-containing protein [Aestuariivirga sp.]
MRLPIFPTPRRSGAGFKPEHLADILADTRKVGFFEVHAENYMGDGGPPHAMLDRLRNDYPIFLHGVAMSIGGEAPLDKEHLRRFRRLVDRYEPHVVSEHLAWSTHDTAYYNDLLPVPYTKAVLGRVVDHIDEAQNALGRPLLLENPSTYVAFTGSEMSETDFIREIARRSGCGLLLDVNNVLVSATNHSFSPQQYLADFPLHLVREIHLAGHATEEDDDGNPLLIDSHDRPVTADVWALYERVIAELGPVPTLIEWDNDVPAWSVLKAEADAADAILSRHAGDAYPELRRAG